MQTSSKANERMANMTFASIYPHYLKKVESKGRSKDELLQIIKWLTAFDAQDIQKHINDNSTFREFFAQATLNPNAGLITGSICGYKVQEIEDPLTQKVRYLDKLVDELAKGKAMEKILRSPSS